MSVSLFGRAPGTWNEEAYFALPETSVKVELFDGDLLVSPRADFTHQDVSYKLHAAFRRRARAAGLRVYCDVSIRLASQRILVPDVVLMAPVTRDTAVGPIDRVQLVVEVTSRSNAHVHR